MGLGVACRLLCWWSATSPQWTGRESRPAQDAAAAQAAAAHAAAAHAAAAHAAAAAAPGGRTQQLDESQQTAATPPASVAHDRNDQMIKGGVC